MTENDNKIREEDLEIEENIDNEDVIMQIFWKHIHAGLLVFSNVNTSSEDAYDRYEKLLTQAYRFLKYGTNTEEEANSEADKKVKEIVKLLLNRRRKIKLKILLI